MKRTKNNLLLLLICIVGTIPMTSCGDDENAPLTNESIVGKKFYTDKCIFTCDFEPENSGYYDHYNPWTQVEIKFSSDGYAYLQKNYYDYETGELVDQDSKKKALYHIDYPDVVFDPVDYDNSSTVYAQFTDNNTLVFEGVLDYYESYTNIWRFLDGYILTTNPQTITHPYINQYFEGENFTHPYTGKIWKYLLHFGSHDAYFNITEGDYDKKDSYLGWFDSLSIDYPNIRLVNTKVGEINGRFINANTIEMVVADSTVTLTRVR